MRMYPRMAEILHLLGSSSLMALPTEADLEGPLAAEIQRYLETDTASAADRVRLFRLAWDTCCSAFASRQVLYERFFQGDRCAQRLPAERACTTSSRPTDRVRGVSGGMTGVSRSE